jgi:hypothetical protein
MFKHRRFAVEIILLCVRRHCKYAIPTDQNDGS